ncbi:hypothetical protein ABKN59_001420 [Abortiporus biennis]
MITELASLALLKPGTLEQVMESTWFWWEKHGKELTTFMSMLGIPSVSLPQDSSLDTAPQQSEELSVRRETGNQDDSVPCIVSSPCSPSNLSTPSPLSLPARVLSPPLQPPTTPNGTRIVVPSQRNLIREDPTQPPRSILSSPDTSLVSSPPDTFNSDSCNDNLSSQNVLCRAKTHFISSIVFAWLWLGAGTINSMVCPTACNFVDNPNLDHGRCGPEVTEAVVAFLMCAINVFLSVYIPRVAKRHEATGLNTNIALGGTSTESQARVWVQRSSTPVTLRATKSASLADDDDALSLDTRLMTPLSRMLN